MKKFLALIALGLLLTSHSTHAQDSTMTSAQRAKFVKDAKEAITNDLLDPGAAQFRRLLVATGGPAPALCGEINAKNRLGAYTGFKLFYVLQLDGKLTTSIRTSEEQGQIFDILMKGYCTRGVTPVE